MSGIYKLVFATILASMALGACMVDPGQEPMEQSAPVIRSERDLSNYLRAARNSPLDRLSEAAKQRFLSGLVFGDNGLGSFRYSELEELSATEIHQILSLFGAERTTSLISRARIDNEADKAIMQALPSTDHEGYYCQSRATCTALAGNICMSSC